MKIRIFFQLLLFFSWLITIGQQPLQKIVALPRERIEITGLQPYYLAGETIDLVEFAKELPNVPTQISVPLYVDFIDLKKGKLLNHFILKITDGKADLSFSTNINLPTGNYQIRAYTNWMRNFSKEGFYQKNITVFAQNYKQEIPTTSAFFDTLMIHPEGGYLVEGLKSIIAIETKDNFGQAISTKCALVNSKNDTLASILTDNNGVASFYLTPETNEKYSLVAENKKFTLPLPQAKGIIFTVDNIRSKEKLRIFIQNNILSTDSLSLAMTQAGQLIYWKAFSANKPSLLLSLPKKDLNGEITCFLLNKKYETLAERTIFINPDSLFVGNIAQDNKSICLKDSHFLEFDKSMKYAAEKGIAIRGNISRTNGKKQKTAVKISLVLTPAVADTIQQSKQFYFANCKDSLLFDNLTFFGKTRATFIAEDSKIVLDSADVPAIHVQHLPINWQLVQKVDLEKRKNEVITEILKKEAQEKKNILLNEVAVKARKAHVDEKYGIPADRVIQGEKIKNRANILNVIYYPIMLPKLFQHQIVKVFVNTQELNQEDIKNLAYDFPPSSVEKIMVFEGANAAAYGADCAIIIIPRRGVSAANFKANESFEVQGYYQK